MPLNCLLFVFVEYAVSDINYIIINAFFSFADLTELWLVPYEVVEDKDQWRLRIKAGLASGQPKCMWKMIIETLCVLCSLMTHHDQQRQLD